MIVNEKQAEKLKPSMPKQCPKTDCLFVYNPRLCYNCSVIKQLRGDKTR